ncbi:hypothetical protein EDC04DRAFT_2888462 [Pisolithus marmoratus]|nr:hypothetical protein EDC04DRAFT_2888462 [Pisolithus marmoratus]
MLILLDISFLDGVDTHAPNAPTVSGYQSLLPLSLPPADKSDGSSPVIEETVPSLHQGHQMYPRLQKKGKGKAVVVNDVDMSDFSDVETSHSNIKKPANLSKAVLEEIHAFSKDVKMRAEELGQWHGHSTQWETYSGLATLLEL